VQCTGRSGKFPAVRAQLLPLLEICRGYRDEGGVCVCRIRPPDGDLGTRWGHAEGGILVAHAAQERVFAEGQADGIEEGGVQHAGRRYLRGQRREDDADARFVSYTSGPPATVATAATDAE
jgi:hypothetical protein